jgi:NTP pyrophosphatase (non-canonical NTP hydrolase)
MSIEIEPYLLLPLFSDREALKKGFGAMQRAAHALMIEKGWYDPPKTFTESVAMVHSEASESLDEFRNGNLDRGIYYGEDGKPEGVGIELADIVLRVMDLAEDNNIDLVECILIKHAFNMTRSHRHGGKKI